MKKQSKAQSKKQSRCNVCLERENKEREKSKSSKEWSNFFHNILIITIFVIGFDIIKGLMNWQLSYWETLACTLIILLCVDYFNPHGRILRH